MIFDNTPRDTLRQSDPVIILNYRYAPCNPQVSIIELFLVLIYHFISGISELLRQFLHL